MFASAVPVLISGWKLNSAAGEEALLAERPDRVLGAEDVDRLRLVRARPAPANVPSVAPRARRGCRGAGGRRRGRGGQLPDSSTDSRAPFDA